VVAGGWLLRRYRNICGEREQYCNSHDGITWTAVASYSGAFKLLADASYIYAVAALVKAADNI
jgi:hypothetical protein